MSDDTDAFLAWLDSLPKEPNDTMKAAFAAYKSAVNHVPDLAAELTDPIAVHANMLRGTIAKPTVEQIIHLYGVDALCKALVPVIVQEAGHNPAPDLAELDAAKIIQKRIDAIIQEEGSWEPDTNVTNLPEWAETAVEELEGILAKIKEPQT